MNPIVLAVALTFAFIAPILAQTASPTADRQARAADAGEQVVRKLSPRERKQRTGRLEIRHQEFVDDVAPIMTPAELDAFLLLEDETERNSFVADFWRRREALNGGTSTATFRDIYYARLATAKEQFRRVTSDRARMFLLQGAPDGVLRADCYPLLQPVEIWSYSEIRGVGANVSLLFYKPRHHNDYRLWNPIGGAMALADLVRSDPSGVTGAESATRRQPAASASPYSYVNRIQLECRNGHEIMRAISQMVQSRVDLLRILEPPDATDEQVRKMLRTAVVADPAAPKLEADFSVKYPDKDGSRTAVQMLVTIPRAEVTPAEVGGVEVYTVDVTGEILKNDRVWEKYRYRFDFPGDFRGETLPVVIDRLLRPADYVSRIKVVDANSGAEALIEKNLAVPEIFTNEPQHTAPAVAAGRGTAAPDAEIPPAADPKPPRLRIIPPAEEIVSGIATVDTIITGEGVKGVEFWLDGRKIAVRRGSPFAVDIDFGEVPRTRRVRAVALDAKDQPITGDDVFINSGTDPFRVRIVSPRIAPRLFGTTRVEMAVAIPEGQELGSLELYWNETRVATLYGEPFVQTIDVPAIEGVAYLRAVANLKDPAVPPVEDVVLINTPAHMEELNVHLVELPTTVLVSGKPASHLTRSSFTVLDEGKPVEIAKFEYVRNLPLSIGLAIDTSGSMLRRMEDAQKAGAQFLQKVMRKGDKAFLLAFSEQPQLVQKWSPKISDVHAGLAKLRAEETTALYDAVVHSLYNFQGVRGQKALVVISDGKDTASKYSYENALDYARRAAVPIYAIGIGIRGTDLDVRHKLTRLCSDTGGAAYYVEKPEEMQRVYDEIENELRSQYILGFYPAPDVKPGKWREVTVKSREGKVKSIRGYFP